MLSFSGSLKVFVAVEPCDLRKGFNGLYAAVTERLGEDPKGGALFVFCNRRRTRIKILYWDGTGLWVLIKRLEQGTFAWPKMVAPNGTKLALTPQALAMLTDGVDQNSVATFKSTVGDIAEQDVLIYTVQYNTLPQLPERLSRITNEKARLPLGNTSLDVLYRPVQLAADARGNAQHRL